MSLVGRPLDPVPEGDGHIHIPLLHEPWVVVGGVMRFEFLD